MVQEASVPVQEGLAPRTLTVAVTVSNGTPSGFTVNLFSFLPATILPEDVRHRYESFIFESLYTVAMNSIKLSLTTSLGHATLIVGQGGGSHKWHMSALTITEARALLPF